MQVPPWLKLSWHPAIRAAGLSLPGNTLPYSRVKKLLLPRAGELLWLTARLSNCERMQERGSGCAGRSWRPAPPPFPAGRWLTVTVGVHSGPEMFPFSFRRWIWALPSCFICWTGFKERVVISARFKKINKRACCSEYFCLSLAYQKSFVKAVWKEWWNDGNILIDIRLWTETVFWEARAVTCLAVVSWTFLSQTCSQWEIRSLARGELWILAVPLPSLVNLLAFLTKILRFSLK